MNPILDIVSLGGGSPVSYIFNATPTILSQGAAFFGGCTTCLSTSGNTLTGREGSGVVEFVGTFSSISWTTSGGEFWNGFTVGVADVGSVTATPEPATWAGLLAASALGLIARKRRFASKRR